MAKLTLWNMKYGSMTVEIKRGLYAVIIVSVLGAALWLLRRHDTKVDAGITSPVLGPKEQEKIILNPRTHTVTTVTRTGSKKSFLPPRTTAIVVGKDGTVTFKSRAYGTEVAPFIGFGYSDRTRLIVGVGLLYWHNWEGDLALAPTVSGPFSIKLAALVSYNVYSNTSLFVGIDNTKSPIGGITFKF